MLGVSDGNAIVGVATRTHRGSFRSRNRKVSVEWCRSCTFIVEILLDFAFCRGGSEAGAVALLEASGNCPKGPDGSHAHSQGRRSPPPVVTASPTARLRPDGSGSPPDPGTWSRQRGAGNFAWRQRGGGSAAVAITCRDADASQKAHWALKRPRRGSPVALAALGSEHRSCDVKVRPGPLHTADWWKTRRRICKREEKNRVESEID